MISVMVVERYDLVRAGLSRLLREFPDIQVVAEASYGSAAIDLAKKKHPEIILMDLAIQSTDQGKVIHAIIKDDPTIKIIVLTSHANEHFQNLMLRAGAKGCLSKNAGLEDLWRAIQILAADGMHLKPSIVPGVALKTAFDIENPLLKGLSDRELEIFFQLIRGLGVRAIAQALGIAPRTVNIHRARLRQKLNLKNDVQLVLFACEVRILGKGHDHLFKSNSVYGR